LGRQEWSDWDERHGRLSRKVAVEAAGAAEIQLPLNKCCSGGCVSRKRTSARQPVLLLLNSSFFLLTFRLASISALKFEGTKKAIIEGKNYELISRNESGDRGSDELRRIDRRRHGPGIAKAKPAYSRRISE
jgi:hypothetical protein